MKKTLSIILPILILATGFFGFKHMLQTKSKTKEVKITEPTWIVSATSIIPTTLSPTVTLYGKVESPKTATLRSPNINAQVLQVEILEGEKVQKDAVLIRLENKDSILKLKQRNADVKDIEAQIALEKQRHTNNLTIIKYEESLLALTKKSLGRLQKLKKQKVSSQSALDEAQQSVERQMLTITQRSLEIKNHKARLIQLQAKHSRVRALRDIAKLELARTKIVAPFAGIVAKVNVAIGDRVRNGDMLLSMYDNSALEVRAQIPTRYQNTVMTSSNLLATTQINNQSLTLKLERISGQINQNSGGIDGLFKLDQKMNLRLGQFLTLFLTLPEQANIVALPYEAVYGIDRIYKFIDGRMQGLKIERIGEQTTVTGKSRILVRSPELNYGDQVIITQLPNAMDGLKVKISQSSQNEK
ncbi:HlyD family efflux transporter periplasmic adaptor subunit [Candidatus Halobeggiatoa sp. HSG11]|nr:HlyD family efflux transporter periplasmic adaptor subunit [Candidatus Halobeggiatoa sp. HSG11]